MDVVGLMALATLHHSQDFEMAEILLPPGLEMVDGTVDENLEPGDCQQVVGPRKIIKTSGTDRQDYEVLKLPAEVSEYTAFAKKAPHAVACILLIMVLMLCGVVPNVTAAFLTCLALGAFGCMSIESAYLSVHWPSLLLIAVMMPFTKALEKREALIWSPTCSFLWSPAIFLMFPCLLIGLTVLVGLFVSNTTTAVLMAPTATSMVQQCEVSPDPFATILALAASTVFNIPVSSHVNPREVEPVRYRSRILILCGWCAVFMLILILCLLLLPWTLPF